MSVNEREGGIDMNETDLVRVFQPFPSSFDDSCKRRLGFVPGIACVSMNLLTTLHPPLVVSAELVPSAASSIE